MTTRYAILALLALELVAISPAERDFFERKIRPVLVDSCYECHNSVGKKKGGLALDYRGGVLAGGDNGPVIDPANPAKSRLLIAIRHQDSEIKMPKDGPKLSKQVVADFAEWIAMGAPDPREEMPSKEQIEQLTSWEAVRERRQSWWSFRPIANPQPPAGGAWAQHAVDRFILARLQEKELTPAAPARKEQLLRRLGFAIIGLPPSSDEIDAFVADQSADAIAKQVDRLLSSPHFGERWGRHWLDIFRYSNSHGNEGDPVIANAHQYRDYLIRAFNQDLPYDQLLQESIAGDLLPNPRINDELGLNESAIGPAHLRMVAHGYAPTNCLDEQVTFTDNQIDVVTKATMAITVSCARCHDHKFDPISQKDFYAMYGIMVSSFPAQRNVNSPAVRDIHKRELRGLKSVMRAKVADAWLAEIAKLPEKLTDKILAEVRKDVRSPLLPLTQDWQSLKKAYDKSLGELEAAGQKTTRIPVGEQEARWSISGNGIEGVTPPGEFAISATGDVLFGQLYPRGYYSSTLSNRHNGMVLSPRFRTPKGMIYARTIGNNATVRYSVHNFPLVAGPVLKKQGVKGEWQYSRFNMDYWEGDEVFLEIVGGGKDDSWFGISEIGWGDIPRDHLATFQKAYVEAGETADAMVRVQALLQAAVEGWRSGPISDEQVAALNNLLSLKLLPNSLTQLPAIADDVASYRQLASQIKEPAMAPGAVEGDHQDQALFVRGDIAKPADPVPRRFLEVIDDSPYRPNNSGRLELARDIVAPKNPLTARVAVNRIWKYLFGEGIVPSVDNFGRLGSMPTHPELLDFLATKFVNEGWSVKGMIRYLTLSKTYQMDSTPSAKAREVDGNNEYLSHFRMNRLDADAIRDSILAVSGQLERSMFGGLDNPNSRRRSIYQEFRRNRQNPFLLAFDHPEPLTTVGRRNITNVPAQSLTLLNSGFVTGAARSWASKLEGATRDKSNEERVSIMFREGLGRAPNDEEQLFLTNYLLGKTISEEDRQQELAIISKRKELTAKIASAREELAAILDPVRAGLLAERQDDDAEPIDLKPLAAWEFNGDFKDQIGDLHLTPHEAVSLEDGMAVFKGGYLQSPQVPVELTAKTLEAWVRLHTLDQRAGGVMTVQGQGDFFDSIVYAEKEPKRWLAGSNGFSRTMAFADAPAEQDAGQQVVQVILVYQADGSISAYRNGQPYGKPYRKGLARFPKDKWSVVFGCRHLPPNGNRYIAASIDKARLYNRALTAAEVAASAGGPNLYISDDELHAALTSEQQARKASLEATIADSASALKALPHIPTEPGARNNSFYDLALSFFNFKEFIFVK